MRAEDFLAHSSPWGMSEKLLTGDVTSTGSFLFVYRKVIRDRLVIWDLKGLFLGIMLGAILGDFRPYFPYFGIIFLIKALVSLESSGA
jgi:F0F1-type ATP synthase assembly protein I